MKIAFILPNLSKNGPIIYAKYLIDSLKNKNVEIDVYCFEDTNLVQIKFIKIIKINFFSKIDFSNYDIVHTHTAKADLFGLINYFNVRKKWVITMHNLYKLDLGFLYSPYKTKFLSFIWSLSFKFCNNIIVFSKSMLEYYQKEIGNKNYAVIRTGIPNLKKEEIDFEEELFLLKLQKDFIIIGGSGHLIKRKGYSQLIELLVKNRTFAVVLTGDGNQKEELLNLADELGVKNRFYLLGFKNNPLDYYKYYDVYVLPSYSEGLPLSLLEAMECELPIVCSNLDNYKDHFSDEDVSFFELNNIPSLEGAILKAIKNKTYFKRKSKENYNAKFSASIMGQKHLLFYTNIINGQD